VGDLVDIAVLIPPGASPAAYEISPRDMRIVSEADVWFTIGLQRESSWMEDFSSLNDSLLILDTAKNIQRLPIDRYGVPEEQTDHHNGAIGWDERSGHID
jgi:zinc transport system substrate-binding protein